jgi:NAD(P)-dependent dehydrogenase (short-subunit alcohol dehydrogenase family)
MSLRFERAIVIGASSGIGAEIARQLAAGGTAVALLGRREPELREVAEAITRGGRGRALTFVHDVTRVDEVPELFERVVRELGGLDAVFYCAGVLLPVEESEYDFAKERQMIEVNLLGAMAWCAPAAARFEAARRGTLVGISSIAGERGRRGFPGYATSKAGLTAFFESLRNRVSRYGVNVVTIKPGFVDTAMTRGTAKKPFMISAPKAAHLAIAAAQRGGSPSVFVPARWALIAFVLRHLPSFVFRRLNF